MTALARRVLVALRRRRALSASWQRLSKAERREFLLFVLLIPGITVALRTLGFRRTHAWLAAARLQPARSGQAHAREMSTRALARARRYAPYRGNCLPQSLALWGRLRQLGFDARLCLGARIQNGEFGAHAWVELDRRVLNDGVAVRERFAAFEPTGSSHAAN